MICTDAERDVLNMMYFICVHVFCNEHADNVFSLRNIMAFCTDNVFCNEHAGCI